MKILFPDIRPFQTEMLDVGHGHQLYLERCGTESGIPVLLIHDGPGAGCSDQMRRFFDPERYHIILFDQRGSGRSTPHASTEHNTTAHLLDDIERIRKHLQINRWVLFGGGFGSVLSLLYAEQYAEKVCGLIVHSIFLGRSKDIDWLYRQGAGRFFPKEWQQFVAPVEHMSGSDIIEKYYQVLHGENELAKVSMAKSWAKWEATNSSFRPNQSVQKSYTDTHTAIALACISTHYFLNHCFLEADQVINDIGQLAGIPGYIVQGRYDMICPPDQAWELSQHWMDGELDLVREGGHSAFDAAMVDALIRATSSLAKRLGVPEDEA